MKREHPILFTAPMVNAILRREKKETRRVQRESRMQIQEGDTFWVREPWRAGWYQNDLKPSELDPETTPIWYEASPQPVSPELKGPGKLRPSIFMPRWASRLTLQIKSIKIQRLHDMTEENATAEGIRKWTRGYAVFRYGVGKSNPAGEVVPIDSWEYMSYTAVEAYARYWDQINGIENWKNNPIVRVYKFDLVGVQNV